MGSILSTYRVTFIIFTILIIVTIIYWKTPLGQNPKFLEYLGVISLLGGVLAIASFIQQEARAEELQARAMIDNIIKQNQDTMIQLENMLINEPLLLRIYKQMYPENVPLQEISTEDGPITAKEIHFTSVLFRLIENIISPIAFEISDANTEYNRAWIRLFKSWFQSEIVRNQWRYTKQFYSVPTQQLVDAIILEFYAEKGVPPGENKNDTTTLIFS